MLFKIFGYEQVMIFSFRFFYYIVSLLLFLLPLILSAVTDFKFDEAMDVITLIDKCSDTNMILTTLALLFLPGLFFGFYNKKRKSDFMIIEDTSFKDSFLFIDRQDTNLVPVEYWKQLFVYYENCYHFAYEKKKITKFRFFFFYILSLLVLLVTLFLLFWVSQPLLVMCIGILVWCLLIKIQKLYEISWCGDKVQFDRSFINKTIFQIFIFCGVIIPMIYSSFFDIPNLINQLPYICSNVFSYQVLISVVICDFVIPRLPALLFGLKKPSIYDL